MKTLIFTALALLAFAGNSVLCRLALGPGLMDAAGFTTIRLLSGAITLLVLSVLINQTTAKRLIKPTKQSLLGALFLFIYALCFSVAYLMLDTGTGALVLFAVVQLTMLSIGWFQGHRLNGVEVLGLLMSLGGLIYLLFPALGSPTLIGFVLMAFSGLAWGLYTWLGQGSDQALLDTSKNFIWTLPLIILLCIISFQPGLWTLQGLLLAVASGALTSGVGYALWYATLPHLKALQAGVVQLLVPVVAALGGVLFDDEKLTPRLLLATALVLGGIYLVMTHKKQSKG